MIAIDIIYDILAIHKRVFSNIENENNEKMINLFVFISNNLNLIKQEYIEILCLLEPSKQNIQSKKEIKIMNQKNNLISAKNLNNLCLPILDICVEFLIKTIISELLRVFIKISRTYLITIQLENDLIILV